MDKALFAVGEGKVSVSIEGTIDFKYGSICDLKALYSTLLINRFDGSECWIRLSEASGLTRVLVLRSLSVRLVLKSQLAGLYLVVLGADLAVLSRSGGISNQFGIFLANGSNITIVAAEDLEGTKLISTDKRS